MHLVPTMSATEHLGEFSASLRYEDLPPATVDRAKQLLLDQLGCQVAFSSLPSSRQARSYVLARRPGKGTSTVVVNGDRLGPEDAAFLNAVSGHGFEYDDTEMGTASHPGAVVIPTALALAEQHGTPGPDVITAMVVGYDIMVRVALSAPGMMQRGFHTTAAAGPFGAAAVAGRLSGLPSAQLASALGIAASQAAGITEYTSTGGSVKRFHPGFAVAAGIRAAALAAAGVDAPSTALEGTRGFIAAFSGSDRSGELSDGLGIEFMLDRTGTKPYCCCAGQHTAIDAMAVLMERDGLRAEEVQSIEVYQRDRERHVVGKITAPKDEIEAQFSAAFGLALRLVTGRNGYADYCLTNLQDEGIRALSRRVTYPVAAEGSLPTGHAPARVVVTRRDGSRIEATVEYALGSQEHPSGWADAETKFQDLADGVISEAQIRQVIEQVQGFDSAPGVGALMRSLTLPKSAR